MKLENVVYHKHASQKIGYMCIWQIPIMRLLCLLLTKEKLLASYPESARLCESVVGKSLSCSLPSEICNNKWLTFIANYIYLMIDCQSNIYIILID